MTWNKNHTHILLLLGAFMAFSASPLFAETCYCAVPPGQKITDKKTGKVHTKCTVSAPLRNATPCKKGDALVKSDPNYCVENGNQSYFDKPLGMCKPD